MHIDTSIGLCVAVSLGAAAYFDYKRENAPNTEQVRKESVFSFSTLEVVVLAALAIVLIGLTGYLMFRVPVLLWEILAGILLGSWTLRLFRTV